ncbi:LacI family transcriptional regulator [Sphaerisporangium siamense]|uniref:LacI family transcriptional regulator n=1 Tax=Sphaerisporangium siamense TaxID=795645 RepID=A0A7W7DDK9_9ACTN|nr:substrate-binding domain-containing protein [Sphaerisporangium siamense]MBB4704894.1 LacI family transcriptional regulator [Sphaerisporangium siamense]GII83696.1 LacI family transcriptional regulator [Sphaerisporangium siamense]
MTTGSTAGPVSIKEVAAQAGVSPGTVSNVLNRPHKVAARTRSRVEQVISELGFVRHGSASTLRAGHSRTIGLSLTDISDPFCTGVAAGVEATASERGYAVILGNSAGDRAREERNLRVFAEQRVRGLIITPSGDDPRRLDVVRERGIHVVLVDHQVRRPDQCWVAVDDFSGGHMAAGHLMAAGATRLAYVTGPLAIRRCRDRGRGAAHAIGAAGQDTGAALQVVEVPAMNAAAGRQAAETLLAGHDLPDAIFCANDALALGLLRGLLGGGVRVPEDVALIGHDDVDLSAASAVSLSSIRRPTGRLGRVATELLIDECENPETHAHRQIVFRPELVPRGSTRAM